MNILFIMADQLRADAFSFAGSPTKTPVIDTLARRGTVFTRAYTNAPLCAPARMALMTGTYPHENGVRNNDPHCLDSAESNYVRELKNLGYHTAAFGKLHLYAHDGSIPDMREAENLVRSYGFDTVDEIPGPRVSTSLMSRMTAGWESRNLLSRLRDDYSLRYQEGAATVRPSVLPLEEYPDVYVGRKACEFFQQYTDAVPWFCFVGFGGPHEPWDAPSEYVAQYADVQFPEALPCSIDAAADRPRGDFDLPPAYPPPDSEHIQQMRRNYAANVTLIDEQIGHIIAAVAARNELESTMIVITSDHGEMNGDYGRVYKSNFLESSAHIPLILVPPTDHSTDGQGLPAPLPELTSGSDEIQRSTRLVELMDLGPTFLQAAGHEGGGRFRSALSISYPQPRSQVLSELNSEYMLRDTRWKVVFNQGYEPYQVFDMENDPAEQQNLAGSTEVRSIEAGMQSILMNRLSVNDSSDGE